MRTATLLGDSSDRDEDWSRNFLNVEDSQKRFLVAIIIFGQQLRNYPFALELWRPRAADGSDTFRNSDFIH
jgi:hypothetical protein